MTNMFDEVMKDNGRVAPTAFTANGALTNVTTANRNLDLFAVIGGKLPSSDQALELFKQAFYEDEVLATRILLWSRDCRGGAGRKDNFHTILGHLQKFEPDLAELVIAKIPELGYWKDMLKLTSDRAIAQAVKMFGKALSEKDGLAAKYAPRKGEFAIKLQEYLNLSAKHYRKLIVGLSNTVEQKMCAKEFGAINYSHVPSKAGMIYRNAFKKRDAARYESWVNSVAKGEAKVNVGQLYPHDILSRTTWNSFTGRDKGLKDQVLINAWNSLPDYYDVSKNRIMSVVDVSGSMSSRVDGSVSAMDISVALGVYNAQRNVGPFKDRVISFTSTPKYINISGCDIYEAAWAIERNGVGYDTNIQAVFDMILDMGKKYDIPQSDMPNSIMVISDMEFNSSHVGASSYNTNYQSIKKKYAASGYEMPALIFWNVMGRTGNNPVKASDNNVALISGYSPSIVQSVLTAKNITPLDVMMTAIMKERYDI